MTKTTFAGAPWRTSSYSANQGQCVEVADVTGLVIGGHGRLPAGGKIAPRVLGRSAQTTKAPTRA